MCGRSACTVRRGEGPTSIGPSYPYRKGTRGRKKYGRQKLRVTKRIVITSKRCPGCKGTSLTTEIDRKELGGCPITRTKRAYDLILTPAGVRRKVIECRVSVHRCLDCGLCFIPEVYQRLDRHFHGLKSWAMYQHIVHRISLQGVRDMIEELFGLHVHLCEVNMFKGLMARYYQLAYDRLLQKILSGHLLLIDETEVRLKTDKGYVWVFASLEEVVYLYRPTREGDFLKEMLKDFRGVLVSDFYAAYDSINCPQQKCLIHLMRDMNQDLLNAPFDEDLKAITRPFGILLRSAVATIDKHGLKRRHLVKHAGDVGVLPTPVGAALPVRGSGDTAEAVAEVQGQALHIHRVRRRAVEQQQCRARHQGVRQLPGVRRGYNLGEGPGRLPGVVEPLPELQVQGDELPEIPEIGHAESGRILREGKARAGAGAARHPALPERVHPSPVRL